MALAVRITRTGSPDVMTLEHVTEKSPGPGQVWIDHEAIGVNYLDVTQRNGAVSIPLPSGLGLEGAGQVTAVAADVTNVRPGDRVAYATGPIGAYSTGRLYPADRLVPLPREITAQEAASVLFKGITAQYLIKSTYTVGPDKVVVLYGAAGGVGQIMARWAKHLGAKVIGIVSKEASVAIARACGCDHVLIFGVDDLPAEIARFTDGKKADVVYDPIGRTTFDASLNSVRIRGTLVSFGASSGSPPPIEVGTLGAKGSLFLTRPFLAAHTDDPAEYRGRALDVLAAVATGIIKPSIWKSYPLTDVAAAHKALESGKSAGAIILTP